MFFCFVGFICQFDFEAVNGDVWCAVVSCHFPVERCPDMKLVETCSSWWCCLVCSGLAVDLKKCPEWNLRRLAVLEAVDGVLCAVVYLSFPSREMPWKELVETCSLTSYFNVVFAWVAVFAVCLVAVWQILSVASWCVVSCQPVHIKVMLVE